MTVKELITELEKCDPNDEVWCNYAISEEPNGDGLEDFYFKPTWVQKQDGGCKGQVWIRE